MKPGKNWKVLSLLKIFTNFTLTSIFSQKSNNDRNTSLDSKPNLDLLSQLHFREHIKLVSSSSSPDFKINFGFDPRPQSSDFNHSITVKTTWSFLCNNVLSPQRSLSVLAKRIQTKLHIIIRPYS